MIGAKTRWQHLACHFLEAQPFLLTSSRAALPENFERAGMLHRLAATQHHLDARRREMFERLPRHMNEED